MIKCLGMFLVVLSLPLMGKSEVRNVEPFDKIELEGYGTLIIKQGDTPGLVVSTDEKSLESISIEVDDKTLKIQPLRKISSVKAIDYRVTVTDLKKIEVQGAASIKSDGLLKVDALDIKIKGTAKADLNLQASELEVEIDGAAQVTMEGMVDRQAIEINGAGKYHAIGLKSRDASIEINGAGKAQVYVTDRLDAEVNGAGAVIYKGAPKVKHKVRGVGTVTRRQDG